MMEQNFLKPENIRKEEEKVVSLEEFLVKAKVSTYASGEEGRDLEDGAKELIFKEGEFMYRDRYYGFNPFGGQEVVFQNEKPIWVMNYYGGVTSNIVDREEIKRIYEFLRKALKQVREDKPFRGPEYFKEDDFEYFNEVEGDVHDFRGTEKIFYKGELVYKLNYHGGDIL
jgi:hypothetical protein